MSKIGEKEKKENKIHDLIVYVEKSKETQWKNHDYQELSDPIQNECIKTISITRDERKNDWAWNRIDPVLVVALNIKSPEITWKTIEGSTERDFKALLRAVWTWINEDACHVSRRKNSSLLMLRLKFTPNCNQQTDHWERDDVPEASLSIQFHQHEYYTMWLCKGVYTEVKIMPSGSWQAGAEIQSCCFPQSCNGRTVTFITWWLNGIQYADDTWQC